MINKQPQYTYLANPETLEVERVRMNGEDSFPQMTVQGYLNKGFYKTRPEIYRRKNQGLLTSKSFRKVKIDKEEYWTNLNLID